MRILPLLLSLSCNTSAPKDPPNVLVFTLDTLRADALGAYGQASGTSPNIDALTAQGFRFTRAYTVTPLTIPAHSSLFTSLWPPKHGVQDNGDFFLDEGADTLAERLSAGGYQTMASVGAQVTSHHWGFAQGFDAYFDDMGSSEDEEQNRWRVERPATDVVADALSWFSEQRDPSKPYFAWLHMFDIHHPYEPPEPYRSQFPGRPYLGEIAWTDAQVQGFLDSLKALGAMENTWIFILADHGEGRGSHGESLHGALLYNATTRIPFIAVPPTRDGGGQRVDFPASIVDVFPTVLSLAGLPVPDDIDGIDLQPWLKAKDAAPALKGRSVYLESLYAYRHYGWAPQKAWVTDTHKLIDSTTPELYDAWDIQEEDDLSQRETDVLTAHRNALRSATEAMVTDPSTAGRAELSQERLEQLAALGYITTTVSDDQPTDDLPDPVKQLPLLREVEQARSLLQMGDVAAAHAQVDAILEKAPTFVDMRSMKAQLLLREGRLLEAYDAAVALDEDHPSTNHKSLIANILLRSTRAIEASHMFRTIVDIDPYLKDAWAGLLTSQFLSGQVPQLDAAVQEAKALHPRHLAVQTFDGIVQVMRGDIEEAEPILLGVLEQNPSQAFVNHSMGLVRRAQGDPNAAELFLTEEIRLHPPALPARRTLVEVLAEQRRYEDQLAQLDIIAKLERPSALTMHSRAQALFNLGRIDDAAAETAKCKTADPRYPGCWMLWANVLSKQGKKEEAKSAYDKAMSLAKPPSRRGQ